MLVELVNGSDNYNALKQNCCASLEVHQISQMNWPPSQVSNSVYQYIV